MDETTITAKLPNLDIEMTRREFPEENAETITLRMRAVPSFEAFAGALLQPTNSGFAPFLAAWTTPAANPFLPWLQMTQAMWAPWLQAALPPSAPKQALPGAEKGGGDKPPKSPRQGQLAPS